MSVENSKNLVEQAADEKGVNTMPISLEVWGRLRLLHPAGDEGRAGPLRRHDPLPAARGLLESVYWHPGMRWTVDRIHALNLKS